MSSFGRPFPFGPFGPPPTSSPASAQLLLASTAASSKSGSSVVTSTSESNQVTSSMPSIMPNFSGPGMFTPEALRLLGNPGGPFPPMPRFDGPPFGGQIPGLSGPMPDQLRGLPPGMAPLGLYPTLGPGGPSLELKSPDGMPPGMGPPPGLPGYFYDPAMAMYPYDRFGNPLDINGTRRKNATRETTAALKAWLYEHRKNPYPTKGEKIMLAIISKMTLTQVSTWFANARRRLKKENKMTWSPRNRTGEDADDDDDADDGEGAGHGDLDSSIGGDDGRLTPDLDDLDRPPEGQTQLLITTDKHPVCRPLSTQEHNNNLSHMVKPDPSSSGSTSSSPSFLPRDPVPSLKRAADTAAAMPNSSPPKKPKIWSIAETMASPDPPAASKPADPPQASAATPRSSAEAPTVTQSTGGYALFNPWTAAQMALGMRPGGPSGLALIGHPGGMGPHGIPGFSAPPGMNPHPFMLPHFQGMPPFGPPGMDFRGPLSLVVSSAGFPFSTSSHVIPPMAMSSPLTSAESEHNGPSDLARRRSMDTISVCKSGCPSTSQGKPNDTVPNLHRVRHESLSPASLLGSITPKSEPDPSNHRGASVSPKKPKLELP